MNQVGLSSMLNLLIQNKVFNKNPKDLNTFKFNN